MSSLRIRQVKPSFWSDAKLLRLGLDVRLFYIGMWGIADDAGWLEWEPEQVAVDLHMREAFVRKAFAQLVDTGRIALHPCGHAQVLHLLEHQHLAGSTRRVETVWREHQNGCSRAGPPIPAHPRDDPPGKVSKGKGKGIPAQPAGIAEIIRKDPETGSYVYQPPVAAAAGGNDDG